MKTTFRVGLNVRKDNSFTFRESNVLSRDHLVRNLNRMMRNGRIKGWKIYDGWNGDAEWELDNERGCF